MIVSALCRQLCPEKFNFPLGRRLGDGSDGEVLEIVDDPKKVIKLSAIYDHPAREIKTYQDVKKVLAHLISTPTDAFVRVYEQGFFGSFSRKSTEWHKDGQDFLMYYYIMDKLEQISVNEFKVFHSILSHEDRKIIKNFSIGKIKEMLIGLSRGLDFDVEKVIIFCNNIANGPIIHDDINPRNIMRNASGDYKLVDLDRCRLAA
jgi:serine/threonine protein kinase